MKNPHGVEPTRFMKRKGERCAIECDPDCGPCFGTSIIYIGKQCNDWTNCWIKNYLFDDYEFHPQYRSSLFVNTAEPSEKNYFTVLDYEVFGIDYESHDNINKLCKHPDVIWEYIETYDISEESLQRFEEEDELLSDLNTIHCDDINLRLKISRYYLKNPSVFLPGTQIVNQQYDRYLKEWLGCEYKWKLIYRASEHGSTIQSFHECCDDKGPTVVVIKLYNGWIFGGYTTQTWLEWSI